MKPTINTVNPKAGTLKPMINAVRNFREVSRKLLAFVLIPGTILANMSFVQDGDSSGKGINNHEAATAATVNKTDTCCVAEKSKVVEQNRKTVKLVLPTETMTRKADSEVISNLLTSIKETNLYMSALMSNIADAEIGHNFESEVFGKFHMPAASSLNSADDIMNATFVANHVGISHPAGAKLESADESMNSLFAAETEDIKMPLQTMASAADQEMNSNFVAETNFHISMPSTDRIAKADNEISKNISAKNNSGYIAKATKKGHK